MDTSKYLCFRLATIFLLQTSRAPRTATSTKAITTGAETHQIDTADLSEEGASPPPPRPLLHSPKTSPWLLFVPLALL